MKRLNVVLFVSLSVWASSCKHAVPKHELCLIYQDRLLCTDERRDPEDYDRLLEDSQDYICTNPDDYTAVKNWVDRQLSRKK